MIRNIKRGCLSLTLILGAFAVWAGVCLAIERANARRNEALCKAVESNDVAEVRRLLAAGVSPNATYGREKSAMAQWVRRWPDGLKHTLGSALAPDWKEYDYFIPVVVVASEWGFRDVVLALLEHGADPNAKGVRGFTPAIISGAATIEMMQLILEWGGRVTDTSAEGLTVLHAAAYGGVPDTVNLALDWGADLEARSEQGDTPLLLAARVRNVPTAKALIARGANVNATNKLGWSPLLYAMEGADKELMDALLTAGARE